MKKRVFTEKQLKAAAGEARQEMLEALPKTGEELPPLSPEFQERMEQLYKAERCATRRRTLCRRALTAAAVLVLAVTCLFAVSPEARASAVNWVKTVTGSWTLYSFNGKKMDKLPDCEITWIPEGMELVSQDKLTRSRGWIYEDPNVPENGFTLDCYLLNDLDLTVFLNDSEYIVQEVRVGEASGELYIAQEPGKNHNLIWSLPDSGVVFAMTGKMETDVMLHIAQSVILVNSDK